MKIKLALLSLLFASIAILTSARCCSAMDVGLGSRKFDKITLAVYDAPADCSSFVNSEATLAHMQDYLAAHAGGFIKVIDSQTSPFLSVQADCMHLVDTRGEGRTVGYTLNIIVQFQRPFYEDITYVYAATWTRSVLLYIPSDKIIQADYQEQLDLLLEEFISLWLDEHNEVRSTDSIR
jgi:hypothetical protein